MTLSGRVAVVVPNWNGSHFLGDTLNHLARQHRPADEVLVVDNASTDGSREMLAADYPEVRVVALNRNTGFAGAANAGLDATDAPLVAILNSDARPDAAWLQELLGQDDDPTVWAWGSVLTTPDGAVESAGDHYDAGGYAYKMARGAALDELPKQPFNVFAPPGACPLFRRDIVTGLGGYDARFFLYYEDVDLAFRALLAGYRAVLVPTAVVQHDLGRSSSDRRRTWFFIGRNSLWCAVRCMPRVRPRILLRRTRREWRIARDRDDAGRAYLAGRLAGFAGLPRAFADRRRIQRSRVISIEQVDHVLHHPPLPRQGVSP
jgi:GT2 family glycosyltransferase